MSEEKPSKLVKIVEPSWSVCLKVWWSLFWRTWLMGLLVAAVVAVAVGLILQIARAEPGMISIVVGAVAGMAMGIVAVKMVLHLKYKEFRISLTENEGHGQPPAH